jgi:amino acid transporter
LIDAFVVVAILGLLLVIGVMATSSRATFISGISRFATYDNITATAHNLGYSTQGPNPLLATLGIMPFVFFTTGFANTTTYYAGEIKSVKKNLFYSQVIVTVVSGIILAIIAAQTVNLFGYDFLGSISYLQGTGASQYPFGSLPPYLNLFVSLLTSSTPLLWLLAIGYIAAQFAPILPVLMVVSRTIFAWSFDGIIPSKFASVNDRLHVPVFAIVIMNILWTVTFVIYTYASSYFVALVSGAGLAELISLIIIAIAAIIFPFRRKDLYESSPARISIGGVPLISITGVLSLFFFLLMGYFFLTNSLYGANTPTMYEAIVVTFLVPAIIYAVSHYYHKSKGLNLSLAFKQIPPE